jgi:hypothetical protein
MRQSSLLPVLIPFVCLFSTPPAHAQSAWSGRGRINVDFGVQPSTSSFTGSTNIPIYLQTETLTTTYSVPRGLFFDGGVILKVSGGFGVDVAASGFRRSDTAPISGTIPHPLDSNRQRPISGTSQSLEHDEITGYIDAAYVLTTDRLDLAVSAGPAFFTVNQDLVLNVTFTEVAPYDTVGFTRAVVTRASTTALGFNAGIDIGVKLTKNIGVGAILRYSKASVTFALTSSAAGVHADVGGAHAGGGLRFYF